MKKSDSQNFIFTGTVTQEPELIHLQSGMSMLTAFIQCNEQRGSKEISTTFETVVFDKLAEGCQTFLRKGCQVSVRGKLNLRMVRDQSSGADGLQLKVSAGEVNLIAEPAVETERKSGSISEEDIPF